VRRAPKAFPWFILVAAVFACRQTPQGARQELARLNVPFTSEEFIARCGRGPTTLIATFLVAGADPNVAVTGPRSSTPLMGAADGGRLDVARQLLQAGARADFRADDGRSPLDVAAANCKRPEMVKLLIDAGARPGEQSLFLALWSSEQHATACSRANLAYLLEAGADVNQRNAKGQTVLMLAADRNDAETVHLFLQHKPDIDLQGGPYRWSALQVACSRARADRRPSTLPIIQELLRAGANPNLIDAYGQTVLSSLGPPSLTPELNPIRNAITGTR